MPKYWMVLITALVAVQVLCNLEGLPLVQYSLIFGIA